MTQLLDDKAKTMNIIDRLENWTNSHPCFDSNYQSIDIIIFEKNLIEHMIKQNLLEYMNWTRGLMDEVFIHAHAKKNEWTIKKKENLGKFLRGLIKQNSKDFIVFLRELALSDMQWLYDVLKESAMILEKNFDRWNVVYKQKRQKVETIIVSTLFRTQSDKTSNTLSG